MNWFGEGCRNDKKRGCVGVGSFGIGVVSSREVNYLVSCCYFTSRYTLSRVSCFAWSMVRGTGRCAERGGAFGFSSVNRSSISSSKSSIRKERGWNTKWANFNLKPGRFTFTKWARLVRLA